MKRILLFLPLLLLMYCSNADNPLLSENGTDNRPTPPVVESEVFNLNDVPSITLEFQLADWNKLLQNYDLNSKNEKKVVSHFKFVSNGKTVVLDSIGLKLRGNTSRRRPEGGEGDLHTANATDWHHCHFSLDFSKYRDDQRFKGLNKMNLKWFKDDASYTREVYCYDLFRRFGCWNAPRSSYCKLTIKVQGDATAAYYGVYEMLEAIDEDFIAKNSSKWGAGTGFLWKGYNISAGKADFVSTASMGVESVNLDAALSQYYAYDLKTREDELVAGKAELTQFITDLNTKTGAEFETWITQKMDINLFLKTYAVNVAVGMWDDYWVNCNNFYFYFATNGKAYFIPYDYDNTLGTSAILNNSGTQNLLTWGNMNSRPLITKILAIPAYQTLYKNYITQLMAINNDYFYSPRSIARIQAWQNKISGFVSNDTGEDMAIEDTPASWGNQPNYRLKTGNSQGGSNGPANYFSTRKANISW
jgi:spore coat protein CotH